MHNDVLFYANTPFLHGSNQLLEQIPGGSNFKRVAEFFSINVGIVDRTNTLTIPVNCTSTNALPAFDSTFSMTYKECIMHRMQELDAIHQTTGKKFRLLYSGGIDSTGILAAFIEYYGLDKTSTLVELCCSPESIEENPQTWDRYVRPGNFKLISSHGHTNMWNDNVTLLMGEGNDQLFGLFGYTKYKANTNLYDVVTTKAIIEFLQGRQVNPNAEYCAEILQRVASAAPFPIENMYMFVWWTNFALIWDAVINRVMAQANLTQLPADTMTTGFLQFFNTPELQQWSLNFHYRNPDRFAELENFKLECKQMIIDVLHIPEYAVKYKFTSFPRVHAMRPSACLIDSNLNIYHDTTKILDFVNPNNTFV